VSVRSRSADVTSTCKVTETYCVMIKLSHAVIKPSHSGFFVIHLVGRGDKTKSVGDETE
jgi:hypothetical protein